MAQIELTWIEQQRFLGVDGSGHSVVLSPPNDVGVKPSETLLIALAACAAHDVVAILEKQRVGLERLSVQVRGEQAADPPWPFERIDLRFRVRAGQARLAQVERAVDLALNKYCSVRASLAESVALSFAVELEAPEPAG